MNRSRFSDQLRCAWRLWIVRFLTRWGVTLRPVTVVALAIVLTGSASVLLFAVIAEIGPGALENVRKSPGFFDAPTDGLTNGVHLLALLVFPLMLDCGSSLARLVGMGRPDPWQRRMDRSLWNSLQLSRTSVVLTHEVVPRAPGIVLSLVLVTSVLRLPLTPGEGWLVTFVALVWVLLWLLRVLVVSRESDQVVLLTESRRWRSFGGWLIACLLGALGGTALDVAGRLIVRQQASDAPAGAVMRLLVRYQGTVKALVVLGLVVLGAALLWRALHPALSPARPVARPAVRAPELLTRGLFPIAGVESLHKIWTAPEVRFAFGLAGMALISPVVTRAIPAATLAFGVLALALAFGAVRLTAAGPSASLLRWRDHVEAGESALGLSARYLAWAGLASAPIVLMLALTGTYLGLSPLSALGLPAGGVAATLLADAIVARPGAALTEKRLLILGFAQTGGGMAALAAFQFSPLLGWVCAAVMLGAAAVLVQRRTLVWKAQVKW